MAMFRSFEGTRLTTRSSILIWPAVISSRPARQRSAVVFPHPDGPTSTRNSPSLIRRSRSLTATASSAWALVTWSKVTLAIGAATLLRQRLRAKPLEMSDELLALAQQPALAEDARPHAPLNPLREGRVLAPDLVVERHQLVDPGLVDVRGEEVVEEARGAFRRGRQDRPAREVRPARKHVDAEVRPDEVELAAFDFSVCKEGVAVLPQRPELARRQPRRLEPVGVGGHVDGGGEAGVRDRAVVALEEVLARDLPVRVELELRAETELERVPVDDLGEARRHVAERVCEW